MKKIILLALLLQLVSTGSMWAGSNWRNHIKVCNNNTDCMKEQAKAQDLWTGQDWDRDLKRSCEHHLETYSKDYIAAVNCIAPLQLARIEYQNLQAQTEREYAEAERARAEARYYRRGGRVIVVD